MKGPDDPQAKGIAERAYARERRGGMRISPRSIDSATRVANRALPTTPRSIPMSANRLLRALLATEIETAVIAGTEGSALIAEAHAARVIRDLDCRWRRVGNYQRKEMTRVITDALNQAYQIGRDEQLRQKTPADRGGAT